MPDRAALDRLITRLRDLLLSETDALAAGRTTPVAWESANRAALASHHLAAYLLGADTTVLTPPARQLVAARLAAQFGYLGRFRLAIQEATEWQAGWQTRASSYAQSIKIPYWHGATKLLPLPAMPGDGTSQCLGACQCVWDIETIHEGRQDYDCRWKLGAADHCQTCRIRARRWAPLQIRGGKLV